MDTKETINSILGRWDKFLTFFLILSMMAGAVWFYLRYPDPEEYALRRKVISTAELWQGYREADGSHREIIDYYNSFDPSPRGYKVSYEDNWCATFVSAVALEAKMTDLIPMECSCEEQINRFRELGTWREDECYLPEPGDIIYYVWDEWRRGNCTAWANHVGIVTETFGPVIKVIEGNKDDAVGYRYILLNDIRIRGYGLPDYKDAVK